jgi:hypothetical protein
MVLRDDDDLHRPREGRWIEKQIIALEHKTVLVMTKGSKKAHSSSLISPRIKLASFRKRP